MGGMPKLPKLICFNRNV